MPPEAYTTLLDFFTHTMNIDYFLSAQVWQENTDKRISDLPLCEDYEEVSLS